MMRKIALHIILSIGIIFTSCKTRKPFEANNLRGEVLVIGHGGSGFDAYRNTMPPNSFASVERALLVEGADGVEIDIQLSADTVLVLYHDNELERRTDCGGCISGLTAADLAKCRYQTRNGGLDGAHGIARLREIFDLAQENGLQPWFFLNVKMSELCDPAEEGIYYPVFAKALSDLIVEYGLEAKTFVETLDREFLLAVRAVNPDLQLIFDDEDFERGIAVVEELGFEGLAISNGQVTKEEVEIAHDKGKWLLIWDVRVLSGTEKAAEKSPEVIMTDDIRMLRGVLEH